jgi:DNA repair photolyase
MIEYIDAKSILSPLKGGPDPYFGITYNMNLYRGCQHQCIYCDTRSNVYRVGNLNHIRIKKNAINLLEQKIRKIRTKGTIGTGSMNDPYMPIEQKEQLTRKALKILAKYNFPVHTITKSNLVTRDIEIWKEIQSTYAAVSFTITTFDDKLSKTIEPGAPNTSERLKAMETLSKHGIYTGAIITPVLPFLTDTVDNITKILCAVNNSGGKYALNWMGMTQRAGQREYYYKALDEKFPGIRKKYESAFGEKYSCPAPDSEELYNTYKIKCQELKLASNMLFFEPNSPKQLDLF